MMVKRFRSRFDLPGFDIVTNYFEDFDTDECFDHINMGFVLEHVDGPALIVRRFKNFLKPGGAIFAAVPNCEALYRRIGHAAELLPDLTVLSDGDRQFGHQRYFSVDTFTRLFVEAG
ncbi:MAG: methyltransferase domain-containing protein [Ahniella sp.]|nr:methyltransferase domain-containing protein [Ahniella sp.]